MKCKWCGAEVELGLSARKFWKSRTLNKQREKARFLHMIFTIMQQEAETRCMAGKFQRSKSMKSQWRLKHWE